MSVKEAVYHLTHYRYDRPVVLQPQITRLQPAPHSKTKVLSHSLRASLAGYVSGFLRTIPPKNKPRLEGADAMHAWVRVWCEPYAGWLEYDPTNAMVAGPDHHRPRPRLRRYLSYSRRSKTGGTHEASQSIDVVRIE